MRTAYDWLRRHAAQQPDAVALVRWTCEPTGRQRLTFAETYDLVTRVVAGLRASQVRPGDRVVLALSNDEAFVGALIGCIGAGAIAVPAPVPRTTRSEAFRDRIVGIVDDCRPVLTLTTAGWVDQLRAVVGDRCPVAVWDHLNLAAARSTEGSGPVGVAFLQYTSGSTRRPRGVVVTHRMLRASCRQAANAYREHCADVAVTWVPLYHDMGLVTGVMRPLHTGYRSVLLDPETFVSDPIAWLRAITAERGTLSSAPNFAYDLCVRKIDAERTGTLNLNSWRVARNAGEVVRVDTWDAFVRRFRPAGFAPEAFCPSYGMAEATLTITTCGPGVAPRRLPVRQRDLHNGHLRLDDESNTVLLSSGVPVGDTQVRVREAVGDDHIGELMVRGPQVCSRYWRSSSEGANPAADGWLPTGDLGFVLDGHVFVCGRVDDVAVVHGRKFHLGSDIVAVCAGIRGMRPGRLSVFVTRTGSGHDQVNLVSELRDDAEASVEALQALRLRVKRALARTLDLYLGAVHFVPAGGLPVTTSGKVRATEVQRRFEAGELDLLGH